MNVADLRRVLRSPEEIPQQAFSLVREIARLNVDPDQAETAHEMILRALEHRQHFGPSEAVVSALARAVGLFPYLNPENLSLRDSIAYEFHRPPAMGEDFVFHREQAEVYRRLMAGESVILSAPTSFGKSRIIDALIAADRFANLVILVPTLALIDETRRRLASYSDRYKIVTHLTQKPGSRTIFVFTAERAVSYEAFERIEFFVIDEFYKIDAVEEEKESKARSDAISTRRSLRRSSPSKFGLKVHREMRSTNWFCCVKS
jgi:hypothetical protein